MRHLKLTIKPNLDRQALLSAAISEDSLVKALKTIPFNTQDSAQMNMRSYLQRALQNVRSVRSSLPSFYTVVIGHAKLRNSAPITTVASSRTNALHTIRSRVRRWRQNHAPVTQNLTVDDYVDTDGYVGRVRVGRVPGIYLHAQEIKRTREIYNYKKPQSNESHVGIELEFIAPHGRTAVGLALTKAGLSKYIHLHSDGSVSSNGGRRGEPCEAGIVCKQKEVNDIIPRVAAVLQAQECYVNRTCGMHVHIDMRNRNPVYAYAQLVNAQPVLYAMVPRARRNNHYCEPTPDHILTNNHRNGDANRYVGVNGSAMAKHHTIEVRIHHGTLNAHKIVNWVDLLVRIVDGKPLKDDIRLPQMLVQKLCLPKALSAYIVSRVAQFGNNVDVEDNV